MDHSLLQGRLTFLGENFILRWGSSVSSAWRHGNEREKQGVGMRWLNMQRRHWKTKIPLLLLSRLIKFTLSLIPYANIMWPFYHHYGKVKLIDCGGYTINLVARKRIKTDFIVPDHTISPLILLHVHSQCNKRDVDNPMNIQSPMNLYQGSWAMW